MPATQPATFLHTRAVQQHRIVYYDRGSGPALLLIHGMFGDHLDWETVLEPFARTHRVIAVDLLGFGQSDKPEICYTTELLVATIKELLDQLGITRAAIVGNSFGGEIATLLAAAHPELATALVLVSSGGFGRYTADEMRIFAEKFSAANLQRLTPELHPLLFARVFHRDSEMRRHYIAKQDAKLFRTDYPSYTRALEQCARLAFELYLPPVLAEMHLPKLLIWGEHDKVFPPSLGQSVLPQIPNAQLELIGEAGHVPQLEQPEAFVKTVERFLAPFVEYAGPAPVAGEQHR